MDPMDSFFQELDSKQLLDRHGKRLVADAQKILARVPEARLAGLIVMEDSSEAPRLRAVVEKLSGVKLPDGLLVVVVQRDVVVDFLSANVDPGAWREEPWQQQQVLPVVVSTRDGFRFGFFGLATGAADGG